MAQSPELDALITTLRSRRRANTGNIDDDRAASDARGDTHKLAADIKCERVGAGGVPAEWINPPDVSQERVLLYLHGGGYTSGSMRSHRHTIGEIARAGGTRALGLDYRLAPENPFPAAVDDSVAAYRWLLSNVQDPAKVVIAGDSAGGGLTLCALIALRYLGEPMPAAAVCLSAWTDMTQSGDSIRTNAEADPTVTGERLDIGAQMYLGNRDHRAPLASPLFADLSGLPPLLMMVGSVEILLDDSTRVTEKARAAGVDVTLEVWDDMPHVWQNYASELPEGQQSIERIGEFIRQHVNGNHR